MKANHIDTPMYASDRERLIYHYTELLGVPWSNPCQDSLPQWPIPDFSDDQYLRILWPG